MKPPNLFMPGLVTIIIMAGFFGMSVYLVKFAVPPDNKDILLVLVGAVAAKFGDCVAYWINSSMGSHNKQRTLSELSGGNTQV